MSKIKDIIFLYKAIHEAMHVMNAFFNKLGLNNMFNHLFNIRIIIDYDKKHTEDICAVYYLDSNIINDEEDEIEANDNSANSPKYEKIYINPDYIHNCMKFNDYKQLAESIIHELIHKNRALLVKVENTKANYRKISNFKSTNKEFESRFNICVLKKELDDYISTHDNCCGRVLLSTIIGNDSYKIYYDFDTKYFEAIDNENNIILRYDDKLSANYDDVVNLASDYYTIKDDNGNELLESSCSMSSYIDHQCSMEEALTETCARIIYESKNHLFFDLNKCCDEVSNTDRLDIKACAKIFKTYGIDLFNWFILSTYDNEYTNMFYEIFKDDYINIIELFDSLYKHNNKDAYDKIISIINSPKLKRQF